MELAVFLVILIGILSLFGTILLGGKGDKNYDNKTKSNLSRLSWIYILLGIAIIIAFAIYLK